MEIERLEVTEEILDRVVYGMENQKDRLYLDPSDGLLKEKTVLDTAFIPLPHWGSSEGYRLMDRFISNLPATAFRDRLSDILHSGEGVFRRFKVSVKERPEMEDLWRRFKYREMRKTALVWLSRWSEALALEALGPEPEEWDDLALTEFSFRRAERGEMEILAGWCIAADEEAFVGLPSDARTALNIGGIRDAGPLAGDFFVAEAPGGDLVGCSYVEMPQTPSGESRIRTVYVLPEFRGLGIGRHLTELAMDESAGNGVNSLGLMTGAPGASMKSWLEAVGFVPVAIWWRLNS